MAHMQGSLWGGAPVEVAPLALATPESYGPEPQDGYAVKVDVYADPSGLARHYAVQSPRPLLSQGHLRRYGDPEGNIIWRTSPGTPTAEQDTWIVALGPRLRNSPSEVQIEPAAVKTWPEPRLDTANTEAVRGYDDNIAGAIAAALGLHRDEVYLHYEASDRDDS